MELRRAFVREPSPLLAEGELTFLDRAVVDVDRARAQHGAYCELLAGLGLDVAVLPAAPQLPDAVFVEDTAVVLGNVAVVTQPGAVSRRAEVATVRPDLAAAGLTLREISGAATVDGGDVLTVGTTIYVGRSTRTNDEGIAQLAAHAHQLGRTVVPVDVTGALHLKTAATALPDGTIVAVPDWLDGSAFRERVREAAEPAGANVLTVARTVVVAASAPGTADQLRGSGLDVKVLDISEFEKVEAGLTCLSILA